MSPPLTQALVFAVAVMLLPGLLMATAGWVQGDLQRSLEGLARDGADIEVPPLTAWTVARPLVTLLTPFLVAVAAVATLAGVVQTRGVWAPGRLAPDASRWNPATGLRRLVSREGTFTVLRSLLVALLVAGVAGFILRRDLPNLASLAERPGRAPGLLRAALVGLLRAVAGVGLVAGIISAVVTLAQRRRRLRMTKDEVRREHRETEGDPQTKAARARAHQEVMVAMDLARVRTATVVVINPTHKACALRYAEDGDDATLAPVVVAVGEGDLAARIVAEARAWGVPVVRDVPLARALAELAVDDAIPEALYEAVAEVLRELRREEAGGAEGAPPQ